MSKAGTMKAIVFQDTGKFVYTDRPVPEISRPDDVKFRILAASICGSDVQMLADPPGHIATKGIILGHECVGEVVETGMAVHSLKPGDKVIFDNNLTCGICPACKSGHSNMCANMESMGSMTDGIFCEYAVAPARAFEKIPMNTDIRKAVLAEPMTMVLSAVKKLRVVPGCTCAVLGGGPLGMMFARFLKMRGAGKVILSEVSPFRSSFAAANGVDVTVNPMKDDLEQIVLSETEQMGADIVVDAVGSLMGDAVAIARPAGTVMLFGMNAKAHTDLAQYQITMKDLTVLGNYIAVNTLGDVANLLKHDQADFSGLITHELPLKDFGTGLAAIRNGEAMKVVLYPEQ
ncbi:MAG: alcohol dehydrogenase catalytic domain-containing protein [Eubacterium sp.]|nr:alcohol dehydrogenase catalytic domain-containing protein [Eubacterium sp.]